MPRNSSKTQDQSIGSRCSVKAQGQSVGTRHRSSVTRLGEILLSGFSLLHNFLHSQLKKLFQNMVCCTYMNIKSSWVQMFWTFNLSFDISATVSATFPNIGRIFAQFFLVTLHRRKGVFPQEKAQKHWLIHFYSIFHTKL